LLADRGYDADWIRAFANEQGAWANIPPKRNRKDPICFSPYLYRDRNLVERFFKKNQAVSAHRDPLRQTRRQLPRLRQTRLHPPMAARL
jgi:transposase